MMPGRTMAPGAASLYVRPMRVLAILLAMFLAPPAAAQVGPAARTEHATSRLVSLNDGFVPGRTNWIALHQQLDDDWHVYWRNPGDSGLPLELSWTLPEGWTAGQTIYPQPHRLPLGPLVNFGHEGAPVFLVPVEVPADAALGMDATLSADASWLICRDVCLPEAATLTMTAPVRAEAAFEPEYGGLVEDALAARPVPAPFAATYYDAGAGPVLALGGAPEAPEFYPGAPNLIEPAGRHDIMRTDDGTIIAFDPGFAYEDAAPETLEGLLVAGPKGARASYLIEAPRVPAPAGAMATPPTTQANTASLPLVLLLALAGGLVLNVMPCVFPVVFMKAAGLAGAAHAERRTQRRHGWLYLGGVLATFTALAGLLIALRAGGEQLGWGFQLQNPVVVGLFAVVIFLVGLNLAGLFEVGTSVQGVGQSLTQGGGNASAFFTGVLAVAVAAPCIGPFLGVPVGYALAQPPVTALLVFLVMGFGLAAPYLALSLVPALGRLLPRPGPWMVTFKQLLSFAMFATLVWLAWVLSLQAGPGGVLALGAALVLAAFAGWAFGRGQRGGQGGGPAWRVAAAVALVLAVLPIARVEMAAGPQALAAGDLAGVPYSDERLAALRAADTPVFVDFTAAWCVTCQVNKQTVLKRPQVADAFAAADATYMVADWTVQDPAITAALERHGRSGVPLYLYYAPGAAEARILPQILSTDTVTGLFERDP